MQVAINSSRATNNLKTCSTIRINFKVIIHLSSTQMAESVNSMARAVIKAALDSSNQVQLRQTTHHLSLTGLRPCSQSRFSSFSVSTYLPLLTKITWLTNMDKSRMTWRWKNLRASTWPSTQIILKPLSERIKSWPLLLMASPKNRKTKSSIACQVGLIKDSMVARLLLKICHLPLFC